MTEAKKGNDWEIVLRKLLLGTVAAAAIGAILHVTGLIEAAIKVEDAPAWLNYVGPLAIHYLGILGTILKHTKVAQELLGTG